MKKEMSIDEFIQAVHKLPSDKPLIPYKDGFTTNKEQWVRWLSKYDRKRNARFVYNHLAYPEMMLWLIQAAGVKRHLVQLAQSECERFIEMHQKAAAIRDCVPWDVLINALLGQINTKKQPYNKAESNTENIRYCRICWNTRNWQKPSGESAKLEGTSYVSQHGFGHEEWLLNMGWIIDGYRYGFLQPLNYMNLASSNLLDIILYTVDPSRNRLFVGRIRNCEIITRAMAQEAYDAYQKKGWLDEMIQDLVQINVDTTPITVDARKNPRSIANVRFRPEDISILDPLVEADKSHKVYRIHRYRPLREDQPDAWVAILSKRTIETNSSSTFRVGKLKSTELRQRVAQKGVSFEPTHNRIQNKIYENLVEKYGKKNVGYEDHGVDLATKLDNEIVYYEIKTDTTAKQCIRLALGQLLEYAHWPNADKAHKLVVVGLFPTTTDTKQYLEYLRNHYHFPIYYCWFNTSDNTLRQLE
jgi:hypothetical protein